MIVLILLFCEKCLVFVNKSKKSVKIVKEKVLKQFLKEIDSFSICVGNVEENENIANSVKIKALFKK